MRRALLWRCSDAHLGDVVFIVEIRCSPGRFSPPSGHQMLTWEIRCSPGRSDAHLGDVVLVVEKSRLRVYRKVDEVVDLLLREALAVRREESANLLRLDIALIVGVQSLCMRRKGACVRE